MRKIRQQPPPCCLFEVDEKGLRAGQVVGALSLTCHPPFRARAPGTIPTTQRDPGGGAGADPNTYDFKAIPRLIIFDYTYVCGKFFEKKFFWRQNPAVATTVLAPEPPNPPEPSPLGGLERLPTPVTNLLFFLPRVVPPLQMWVGFDIQTTKKGDMCWLKGSLTSLEAEITRQRPEPGNTRLNPFESEDFRVHFDSTSNQLLSVVVNKRPSFEWQWASSGLQKDEYNGSAFRCRPVLNATGEKISAGLRCASTEHRGTDPYLSVTGQMMSVLQWGRPVTNSFIRGRRRRTQFVAQANAHSRSEVGPLYVVTVAQGGLVEKHASPQKGCELLGAAQPPNPPSPSLPCCASVMASDLLRYKHLRATKAGFGDWVTVGSQKSGHLSGKLQKCAKICIKGAIFRIRMLCEGHRPC